MDESVIHQHISGLDRTDVSLRVSVVGGEYIQAERLMAHGANEVDRLAAP